MAGFSALERAPRSVFTMPFHMLFTICSINQRSRA
jgi:hypothetical protein